MKNYRAKALFLIAFTLLLSCVPMAWAQDCGSIVSDGAGVFGSRLSDVETAARALQNEGLDVYVRTFANSNMTVDELEHSIQNACSSWRSASGGRKGNLVAMVYVLSDAYGKHGFGFYTGDDIDAGVSKAEVTKIKADKVAPKLKSGNAAAGFILGLDAMRTQYHAYLHPETTDYSGVGRFFKMVFFIFLGGFILLLLIHFLRGLNSEGESRREALQKAKLVYDNLTAKVNSIGPDITTLKSRLGLLASKLRQADQDVLGKQVTDAETRYKSAVSDFGAMGNSSLYPKSRWQMLTVKEYANLQSQYQGILDRLSESEKTINTVNSTLDLLEQQAAQAPKKVALVQTRLDTVAADMESLKGAGFRTTAFDDFLAQARTTMATADQQLKNSDFFAALASAEQANGLITEAAEASKLPDLKADLDNKFTALQQRIAAAQTATLQSRTTIQRMESTFALESFESVHGNGSQAVDHINFGLKALPAITAALSMDSGSASSQNWDSAEEVIKEANAHLDRVDSLLAAIASMEQRLNEARAEAPKDVALAQRDLRTAQENVNAYRTELSTDADRQLGEAGEQINAALQELQKPKPDYFAAVKAARKAHEIADALLVEVRSEHEAAQRLKEQVAQTLRDAESRVEKAANYVENHERHVKRTAKSRLDDAQQSLAQAREANQNGRFADAVNYAQAADSSGKAAYNKAKSDVEEATNYVAPSRRSSYYAPSDTTILINNTTVENNTNAASASASSGGGWGGLFGSNSDDDSNRSSSSSNRGSDNSSSWDSNSSSRGNDNSSVIDSVVSSVSDIFNGSDNSISW